MPDYIVNWIAIHPLTDTALLIASALGLSGIYILLCAGLVTLFRGPYLGQAMSFFEYFGVWIIALILMTTPALIYLLW